MKKKRLMIIGGVVLVLCVLAICIFAVTAGGNRRLDAQLELGARYLEEMDYEQAVAAYTTALEIDPRSADAYLGLAEAYVGLGEYDAAETVLQQGYERTGDERLKSYLEELISGGYRGDEAASGGTGADPAQGGEGTLSGDGQENPVRLYQMFEEGNAGGLLSWEEITFFGHGIPDLDYQTARELLLANGFSLDSELYERHESDHQYVQMELGGDGTYASIMQYDDKDVLALITYEHMDYYDGSIFVTQIREIGLRDSFAEVLSKLGFTNTDAIDAYIREAMAAEYHSYEEIVYPGGLSSYRDAAHDSYIDFKSDAGTSDDGATYHFSDFSLTFNYWYEGGGSVGFDFDEGFRLKRIRIHNSAG